MNRNQLNLKRPLTTATVFLLAVFLLTITAAPRVTGLSSHAARAKTRGDDSREKYLFVWAGDQARTAPDFLAVVDFDEGSPGYGNVITAVPLPDPGATGNEPHHVGLSRDGKVLACGGLLSVLKGQKQIFFFDVSNPEAPRLDRK